MADYVKVVAISCVPIRSNCLHEKGSASPSKGVRQILFHLFFFQEILPEYLNGFFFIQGF